VNEEEHIKEIENPLPTGKRKEVIQREKVEGKISPSAMGTGRKDEQADS